MCGRFIRTSPLETLRTEFEINRTKIATLSPRYNICPAEAVVAVIQRNQARHLGWLHWGFTPIGMQNRLMINARAETIDTRQRFQDAFRRRRCLVIADGFYEWQREGSKKTPWLIRLKSQTPIAFAGIWESRDSTTTPGKRHHSCLIVTCPPNDRIKSIHDRMPVILPPTARTTWLNDDTDFKVLSGLLQPLLDAEIEAFPVTKLVNTPKNDSAALIEPLTAL